MNRKHRIPALLLCLCMLLTAGCSRREGETAREENVSYSQTLYPGMEMSAEQKNAVRAVEGMLSRATLDVTDESLTMVNTAGFPLTGSVTIRHYDKDGVYVGESDIDMDEWPAGAEMRVVAKRDYAGWSSYEKADIGAEFLLGGSYVATSFLPVGLNSGKDRVSLSLWKELPLRIRFDDYRGKRSYLLWDMTTEKNDAYTKVCFFVTMESGKPASYDRTDYRVVRDDGVVVEGGSFSASYLNPGETARIQDDYVMLDSGSYVMELFGADIEIESATQADVDAARGGKSASAPATAKPTATPAPTPTPTQTPAPTPTPAPAGGGWEDSLKEIERQIEAGEYYEAALAILDCCRQYPDAESACNELMQQIKTALRQNEPKTGELERSFQYQGGNQVCLTAVSGPLEVTIRDANKASSFVRFYVRQNETSQIYLPAGSYTVSYKVGIVWFDNTIGFGEVCSEGAYNGTLEFKYTEDNAWITNYRWSDSI